MSEKSLEQSFTELETVLTKLDDANLTLEQSFEEYKKGMELLKEAGDAIDRVEKKVLILSGEGELSEL